MLEAKKRDCLLLLLFSFGNANTTCLVGDYKPKIKMFERRFIEKEHRKDGKLYINMGLIKFIKTWTLPLSITFGAVIYLIFAFTPCLLSAAMLFAPFFNAILPLFMFLVLFVTFCKVDFKKLRVTRWHGYALVAQFSIILILLALTLLWGKSGSRLVFCESILICVICPCATAAAVVTQKLGGSIEEMTTYTYVSNFFSSILIPICLPLIDTSLHISFLSAFLKILYQVLLVLVLPMFLAYVVKKSMKNIHRKIVSVKDLSYYLWACSLLIVSGTTIKNIVHAQASVLFLLLIAVGGLVVCLVQFMVGRSIGLRFNRRLEAGQGLGQKNTAFAIWIANAYLTPLSTVGPGCYILWQNIINSIEIARYDKQVLRNAEKAVQ